MKEIKEISLKKNTTNFTYKCQLCMNPNYEMENWLISHSLLLICPRPVSTAAMIEKYIHRKSQRKVKQMV